ncbi:ABC transporter permease subunit [Blastococcus sp. PRF04-17]|uniref:ABC transporter permease subunit n=1 Tax=Blastococcus sp. PRF04-17 TaxID=2933797 RepID=UPI001FF4A638|nr:ABC transporter permease subunit [Blastococcus sp. PRF04-17]UOY00172.1 ABC transporter permease subunit [Blastococcus sp. PRF04-17]
MAGSTIERPAATTTAPPAAPRRPGLGLGADGTGSPLGLVLKIVALGLLAAVAVWGALPLIRTENWIGLAILVAVTLFAFYVYLSPRQIPLKYLLPGTIFLIVFQILPVIYTISTAFTNFSDGHRGDKDAAIAAIEGASVQQIEGSTPYVLTIATSGDASSGDIVFLLADPATDDLFVGTADGLRDLTASGVEQDPDGKITAADTYTVLEIDEIAARQDDITTFSVPTDDGAIVSQGVSQAFEGAPLRTYDSGCDCITDETTGTVWTADDENGSFVDEEGNALAQGWQVGVGFRNFGKALTDETIRGSFLRIVLWNFAFAIGTVAITFGLGLLVAIALNNPLLKRKSIYRSLIILPYAMPAVAMYLVWREMFNTDFGLINRMLGIEFNWFGNTASSMIAILLVQLWLGYNYMFLVITGALQSIPADLTEAAGVDGARPFYAFRTITFPLLLVALAPLLIASFAFNFNNFSAIYLVSGGAPFSPDNPAAGGTDILITYTYRLAFGGSGADYGFAAAISCFSS